MVAEGDCIQRDRTAPQFLIARAARCTMARARETQFPPRGGFVAGASVPESVRSYPARARSYRENLGQRDQARDLRTVRDAVRVRAQPVGQGAIVDQAVRGPGGGPVRRGGAD